MNRTSLPLIALCALLGGLAVVTLSAAPDPAPPQSHAQWVAGVLKEITALKPGINRAEFEKLFTLDGGITGPSEQRYCYREASCIKVDVTFEAPADSKTPRQDPAAKLTTISRPYLQAPAFD